MHVFPFANKRNAVIGLVLTLACSFIGQALAYCIPLIFPFS